MPLTSEGLHGDLEQNPVQIVFGSCRLRPQIGDVLVALIKSNHMLLLAYNSPMMYSCLVH